MKSPPRHLFDNLEHGRGRRTPRRQEEASEPLSALVFKTLVDPYGKISFVREMPADQIKGGDGADEQTEAPKAEGEPEARRRLVGEGQRELEERGQRQEPASDGVGRHQGDDNEDQQPIGTPDDGPDDRRRLDAGGARHDKERA